MGLSSFSQLDQQVATLHTGSPVGKKTNQKNPQNPACVKLMFSRGDRKQDQKRKSTELSDADVLPKIMRF